MKLKRIILITLSAVILIVVAVFSFIKYTEYKVDYTGEKSGLVEQKIAIKRNACGVPLVNCSTEKDMFFALGYLHAQDKIPMLIYFRALSEGNTSELKMDSSSSEEFSFFLSMLDITTHAEKTYSELNQDSKDKLISYSDGINKIIIDNYSSEKNVKAWLPQDTIKILILRLFADSYINDNDLVFPFKTDDYYKMLNLISSKYMRNYRDNESKDVNRLLRYKKYFTKYVGIFNNSFSGFRYNKEKETADYFLSMENNSNLVSTVYPVYVYNQGKFVEGITFAGLPFIFYGKTKDYSYSIRTSGYDTINFKKLNVKEKNGEFSFYDRGRYSPIKKKSIKEEIDYYSVGNYPIINDLKKSRDNKAIVCEYNFNYKDFVETMFQSPFNLEDYNNFSRNDSIPATIDIYTNKTGKVNSISFGKIINGGFNRNVFENSFKLNYPITFYSKKTHSINKYSSYYLTGTHFSEGKSKVYRSVFNNDKRMDNIVNELKTDRHLYQILLSVKSKPANDFLSVIEMLLKKIPVTSGRLSNIYIDKWDNNFANNKVAPSIVQYINYSLIYSIFYDEVDNPELLLKNYHLFYDNYLKLLKIGLSGMFDDKNTKLKYEDINSVFDKAFILAMREMHRNYGARMQNWKYSEITSTRLQVPKVMNKMFLKVDLSTEGDNYSVKETDLFYDPIKRKIEPEKYTSSIFYSDESGKINCYLTQPVSLDYLSDFNSKVLTTFTPMIEYSEKSYLLIIKPY